MDENDLVKKSDIRNLVGAAPYPCNKQQLKSYASENGADDAELDLIEQLPEVTYNSWSDVDSALGRPTK